MRSTENTANIYFDFNEPVITEPSVLVAEFSTGMGEVQHENLIALAPVPASDELILTSEEAIGLARILAADGREVMRLNSRSPRVRIDLDGMRSGAYLIVTELESGNVARDRFIKQ